MLHTFRNLVKNKSLRPRAVLTLASGVLTGAAEVFTESGNPNRAFLNSTQKQNLKIAAGISGFASGAIGGFVGGKVLGKVGYFGKLPGLDLTECEKWILTGQVLFAYGSQRTGKADKIRCNLAGKVNSVRKKLNI